MNDKSRITAATPGSQEDSLTPASPQQITPEILTVIQTAAAVFVAKKMQSEKTESAPDKSWSIKGREIVQASHNVVQRGH